MKRHRVPRIHSNRRLRLEQLEGRRLLAGDLTANLAAEGEGSVWVRYRLETADASGRLSSEFAVGDTVELRVYVQDVRPAPSGVFSSYMDITYNAALLNSTGSIDFGTTYVNFPSGDNSQDGLIDEVGAFSNSLTPLGGAEFLLFSTEFTATEDGSVTIVGDPADVIENEVSVYGLNDALMPSQVDYGTTTIEIVDDIQIIDDGAPGYSESGSDWGSGGLAGAFQADYRYHQPGTGTSGARWAFSGLGTGSYEVYATWTAFANRASNAPFLIHDGAALEGTISANQRIAPNDLTAEGQLWESLGTFQIDSGSLIVNLSDAADGVVIADAVRISSSGAGAPPPSSDEQIVDNSDAGYSMTGTDWKTGGLGGAYQGSYQYHAAGIGSNVALWTFSNLAAGDYDLYATWTAHANRASNARFDLADGATIETSVMRDQRIAPDDLSHQSHLWESLGTVNVDQGSLTVSLSDAANGFVIADAVYLKPSDGPPPPPPEEPLILDDGDPGFVLSGVDWRTGGLTGAYEADYQYHLAGAGEATAEWRFAVDNGNYAVYATWTAFENRASNAPFTVLDGTVSEGTVPQNQQAAADDLFADGVFWEQLGEYEIENGMLTVRLSNNANGIVIADAVRIESTDPPPPPPPGPPSVGSLAASPNPAVLDDTITLSALGVVDDETVTQVAFYRDGNANGTLETADDILLGTDTNGADGYQASIAAAGLGVGSQTFFAQATDNLGLLSDPESVVAEILQFEQIVDDGGSGYSEQGALWQMGGLAGGHGGDYRSLPAGTGSNKAIWQATVPAGTYEIFATWTSHANRASNASYSVLDGSVVEATANVDQRLAPNGALAGGTNWESLGTVSISSGLVRVELSDLADGFVIADAIRLVGVDA